MWRWGQRESLPSLLSYGWLVDLIPGSLPTMWPAVLIWFFIYQKDAFLACFIIWQSYYPPIIAKQNKRWWEISSHPSQGQKLTERWVKALLFYFPQINSRLDTFFFLTKEHLQHGHLFSSVSVYTCTCICMHWRPEFYFKYSSRADHLIFLDRVSNWDLRLCVPMCMCACTCVCMYWRPEFFKCCSLGAFHLVFLDRISYWHPRLTD